MAVFELALPGVLLNEGGYVNRASDHGGETYKGISRVKWPNWTGWAIVDAAKSDPTFPKNLDTHVGLDALISKFYLENFWRYDAFVDQIIANKLFDMAVNMGEGWSTILLERGLDSRWGYKFPMGGEMTPEIIAAANGCHEEDLMNELRAQSVMHYAMIVVNDVSQKVNMLGWIRRACQ